MSKMSNGADGTGLQRLAQKIMTKVAQDYPCSLTTDQENFVINEYNKTLNLFDKLDVAYGAIYSNSGVESGDTSCKHSNYIKIEPNTTYSNNMVGGWSSGSGLAFYDSSYTYISGIASSSASYNQFTTPSNAKYVRISFYIDSSSPQYVTDVNTLMFNKGAVVLSYQSYNGDITHQKYVDSQNAKSLYKLGYYDTYVDNGDGTVTITRQTGYVDLGSLSWAWTNSRYWLANYIANIGGASSDGTVAEMVCNNYTPNTIDNVWGGANGIAFKKATGEILCLDSNGSSKTPSGSLQFKLVSSYTEKVIKKLTNNQYDNFLINKSNENLNVFRPDTWTSNRAIHNITYLFNGSEIKFTITNSDDPYAYMNFGGLEVGKTYTITLYPNQTLQYWNITNNSVQSSQLHNGDYYTFVAGATSFELGVEFNSGYSTCDVKIMIVEGSQSLPYYPTREPVLLWINPSPRTEFAPTNSTITVADMSKYKYIVIEAKRMYDNNNYNMFRIPYGINNYCDMTFVAIARYVYTRSIGISSSTTILVENGYFKDLTSGSPSTNNGVCVITRIFGTNTL